MVNLLYKHVKGTPYPKEIRELVLAEYYRGVPRNKLAMKYNIDDPTVISHWVRNFDGIKSLSKLPKMNYRIPKKSLQTDHEQSLEDEIRRLKRELSHKDQLLQAQSKRAEKAELKGELLNMMIDIAENKLRVDIRKKSGPKR